ncbi:M20/M25/M40 family metallo-hydrolase [Synechococcus sp. BO 8801]|uniref:M20/M25/M40 family metallo-hydrolase n=1 Tax=Synechococcus sp. BO 8801 TaxID=169670 RepID=UPI001180E219|nr:M20/M25/M40 family metallo-hydrolase [Synechococcus sp. BO 8801]
MDSLSIHRPTSIFFDLGDTLGAATVGGTPPRLIGFDIFPFVPSLLTGLRDRGLQLGLISNTGDEQKVAVEAVLTPTGLLAPFNPALLVYSGDEGITKASPEIFDLAASRAGMPPEQCLFVGESAAERAVAASAGWVVCPHPHLVDEVLDGQQLRYLRLTIPAYAAATPWRDELIRRAFVPQYLTGPQGMRLYGLTSQRVALELFNLQFGVDLLGDPDLPCTTDLFLLRDDLARTSGFLVSGGESTRVFGDPGVAHLVLSATPEGLVVAVPPTIAEGVDAFHFDSARHGHTLKLTPDLLLWGGAAVPVSGFAAAAPILPAEVITELGKVDPAEIGRTVRKYSGLEPLDGPGGTALKSRHILEGGNARAVAQLAADFDEIGGGRLTVRLHQFLHAGQTLHNVEAELAGGSPELVLVTAHLDSTAASDDDFVPMTSPAPGADDDASGVAAVLAAAERFVALFSSSLPSRTVRFVLFNAEEQGLAGSQAYAQRSKARGEAIAAVWQMDMVGFNAVPPLSWEVHAGFETSPAVEARSRILAKLLSAVAPQVSPELEPVQVLHSAAPGGDPADGRSDHFSFQAQGYSACVVSEDFFVDVPGGQEPDANPNYHRHGDVVIDTEYTAAIARAVTAAAWVTANQIN